MNESKELAQPQGIETQEVGQQRARRIRSTVEQVALVCHEANRAWCEANGDFSQVEWDRAAEWQKTSAMNGVRAALAGATPEQLHESWSAEKRAEGWVYGEVKNPSTKEHPCLVPYDKLPAEQQRKDHLFSGIVRALTSPLGGA
jgi:hypothetical protein